MTSDHTSLAAWSVWLDAVEAAARRVEQQAFEHGVPQLVPLPMPDLPWPASLEGRRREVLGVLAAATTNVERCRDEAGSALRGLPTAGPRAGGRGYTDGSTLDVLG